MSILKPTGLNSVEKQTFSLHLSYSFIEGIILGIIALNEFVFVKSLFGSSYQLSILFQFSMVVFILLAFFNELLKRVKNMPRLLKKVAIFTRLPLLLLFFFPHNAEQLTGDSIYHYLFLAIFMLYYLANPIIFPSINLFLKTNYRHENFGKLYSYAITVNKIVMMITTFAYGYVLDLNNYIFVYIFPVAGVLGIINVFLLSRIPFKNEALQEIKAIKTPLWNSVKNSVKSMIKILKDNVPYRHFQMGFMLYGFGFMGSAIVIVLFFEHGLSLNYTSIAFYKNGYNIIAIFLIPLFGKLIGNMDPRKFAALSFISMIIYLFALILTGLFPVHIEFWGITLYYMMIIYILFHSVFAATMSLMWSIGSAYFCHPSEAGIYQSIHLVLTGIRAIFAPLLGVVFYELWGFNVTFIIAMSCLLTGSILMLWSERNYRLLQ
ncbi:MAG: MFS transporter [Bacteroidota bacterium]